MIYGQGKLWAQCNVQNQTFRSGEYALYQVYYNWGFLWFHAAEATFETRPALWDNKKAYHFVSTGKTLPNYDWFFKVRDVYESIADSATLSPQWFSRVTSEGGFQVNNQYTFKQNVIHSSIQNSNTPRKTDTLSYSGCVYDLLTAIYATRTLSYNKLRLKDTVGIRVVVDNEIFQLTIRYLGVEEIENKDEIRYRCQKFAVELVAGTIFTGGEEMVVWVTDDKAKVPVRVEAKILIGSIVAHLASVSGSVWPINAIQP
ncbi:MAG: DUF3108 domain-containing protein [Salinivirgaceae bacterium]